jgi:hypothetical protein
MILESQYHPAGNVMCKFETNNRMKWLINKLETSPLYSPNLEFMIYDDENISRLDDYRVDPRHIAMNLSKAERAHNTLSSNRSREKTSLNSRRSRSTNKRQSKDRYRSQSKRSNSFKKLHKSKSKKSARSNKS